MVLCMTELDFLKIIFLPPKMGIIGQVSAFFECIGKFFSILHIMKVYINCCMLRKISYFVKFGFLRYGPKCS